MKRRFSMTVFLEYVKPATDGSGEELREEMEAIETAIESVVVNRAGRSNSGSVVVKVTAGNSKDA